MPEPISSSLATAAGTAFVLGAAAGAGNEVGKRVAACVCDGVSKATEQGWQRHDEANEALGTGLSTRRTAQA